MANLQDVVLEAVDTIVSNRIEQIATDKTVTATVAGCTNSLTGEYLVSYNGGKLKAYATVPAACNCVSYFDIKAKKTNQGGIAA